MDAQQALADLTEISSQIQAAVVFDDQGKLAGSTLEDDQRAEDFARSAAELLEQAQPIKTGDAPLTQLEVSTEEGSVFVVSDGAFRIAATTPREPTVGLVFYDLKSALRQVAAPPQRRAATRRKPSAPKPATTKKATGAQKAPAAKKPAAPRKKPPPRRKPDAS